MKDHSKSAKYRSIVASAKTLFWKHGFRRVSIEEVCQHAGVSKMTFYRFFPNKVELARTVFDQEAEKGLQQFRNILHEDTSSAEKIRKIVQTKMQGTNDISREFIQDFYANRELGLKEYIEEKTARLWAEMLQDFRLAQEKGWFRRDLKPEFLFFFSQKVADIMTDERLMAMYNTPQELVGEITRFFTYGISPAPGEK